MSLEVIMKFIAKNPPSILFLGAILLMITSALIPNSQQAKILVDFAYNCFWAGILLQILWIIYKLLHG